MRPTEIWRCVDGSRPWGIATTPDVRGSIPGRCSAARVTLLVGSRAGPRHGGTAMRLVRSTSGRCVMTVLLTLVLLASAQQRVQAGHVILYTGLGAAAGAVVVWLIQRSGDDPPTPSTQDPPTALRSTSWRPLPAMAQEAFEKHFGAGFPPSTHRDPRPIECLTSRGVEARWPACGSRELRGVQGAFSRPGR